MIKINNIFAVVVHHFLVGLFAFLEFVMSQFRRHNIDPQECIRKWVNRVISNKNNHNNVTCKGGNSSEENDIATTVSCEETENVETANKTDVNINPEETMHYTNDESKNSTAAPTTVNSAGLPTNNTCKGNANECIIHCSNDVALVDGNSATNKGFSQSFSTLPDTSKPENRRSKSRVRSYIKKCKERLTGGGGNSTGSKNTISCQSQDEICSCVDYPTRSNTSSSWYIENMEPPDTIAISIEPNSDGKNSVADSSLERVTIDQNATNSTTTEPKNSYIIISSTGGNASLPEDDENGSSSSEITEKPDDTSCQQSALHTKDSGIESLLDKYLAHIYPKYFEHTRQILVRQARDLLVCTYHGCLREFEKNFLEPYSNIASKLKEIHRDGEPHAWCRGWPLATESGELILHLGTIDESILRPHDIYIFVKPDENSQSKFYIAWRSIPVDNSQQSVINYKEIVEYEKEFLSPLSLEMLTDELPQLLQNLVVGIERTIGRIPLNELTFPITSNSILDKSSHSHSKIVNNSNSSRNSNENNNNINKINNNTSTNIICNSNENNNNSNNTQSAVSVAAPMSPKRPLKRSELITKNNIMSNKFFLKRLSSENDTTINSTDTLSNESASSSSNSSPLSSLLLPYSPPPSSQPSSLPVTPPEQIEQEGSKPTLPVFCLGGSFPHIDSDEENSDERKSTSSDNQLPHEIVAPRSILELPEKLLSSGVHLPGTKDLKGRPIITIDGSSVTESGLNCYEIATVLLYYSTIPKSASSSFTILLILRKISDLPAIELICSSLKLLTGHFECDEILCVCLDNNVVISKENTYTKPVKHINLEELRTKISLIQIPEECGGLHCHNQSKWREFFITFDTFQSQCLTTGHRLVSAMSDIRASDLQGLPSRRQLYAQHRALSRALMDSELHHLRKRGPSTISRLKELAKNYIKSDSSSMPASMIPVAGTGCIHNNNNNNNNNSNSCNREKTVMITSNVASNAEGEWKWQNEDITTRLSKVIVLFNEVDRAAKRLEQLTEQRRERMRELTRQRALEDEINEVISWIQNDGDENLRRFLNVSLECEDAIKGHEQDFEKYYFISMKHLAKGKDLHDAAIDLDPLKPNANSLKEDLDTFSERLENTRERIEGAARLHHLLGLDLHGQDDVQQEMQNLAEKIGVSGLIEKCRQNRRKSFTLNLTTSHSSINSVESGIKSPTESLLSPISETAALSNTPGKVLTSFATVTSISSSTPISIVNTNQNNPMNIKPPNNFISNNISNSGNNSSNNNNPSERLCHCWRQEDSTQALNHKTSEQIIPEDEEEEDNSKIADSGLGGCDRCEGNMKLSRVCSCQSFDETGNLCDKSHNSDEMEEDCFEGNPKQFLNGNSPIEANSHLQYQTSDLELPKMEELSGLDPKIQKTLLLIIREMIATERDYVRSLYYVIENYVDELLRDDIPQPLRGQRNVIFGNIEKIFEFHQPHFLVELERYETNPLKVGAAFLENESKFYLYALYNKNKPKSDTLMSEYGTAFFKSKQIELNDKMDLASYLLKPVQRMGKYALLLQQLVKACSNVQGPAYQEIAADVEELQKAEEMVKFQLRHGNDLLAMDSLRDCDVNVKEQGRLLRQNEFLVWQGRGGKKSLRQVFLFEELVLFSKARRFPDHKNLDIYIYKNSIKTSDIGLTAHISDSPTKFEIWFRKRKPDDTWTLQSMSEDIKNAWTEEISRLLWKQAKRNREIRLAEMSSMGIGSKPCLDIRPSLNQINDRSITFLQLGKTPKLRNSFINTAQEGKQNKRPNSIISEGSMSSGTSISSLSTGTMSSSGSNNSKNQNVAGLELISETSALNNGCNSIKKHQRSTTLVSQLSMESGILSDISMTPDGETHEPPHWPVTRKSSNNSTGSATDFNKKIPTNNELNLAEQDPYINDSVTVHL